MTIRSSRWLQIGEWVVNKRWWIVTLASLTVFTFEFIEYQPFFSGINQYFLFEILFYGVILPLSTGLALTWLASSRSELAWSGYYLNVQRNLRMYLNKALSDKEVATALLQVCRVLMPLVGASFYVSDKLSNQFKTIMTWSIQDGLDVTESRFICDAEECTILRSYQEDEEMLPTPCRNSPTTTHPDHPTFCVPFVLSGSPVAGVRLHLEHNKSPSSEQARLLKEITPEMASAFERTRLEQSLRRQRRSLRAEQQRIARDVHDSLGHSLAYLRLRMDQLTMGLNQTKEDMLRREVEAMRDIAKEAYDQMREVLVTLSPDDDTNLNRRIQNYTKKIRKRVDFNLELQQGGKHQTLPETVQRNIFFIFQEAITNIEKHALAENVVITLNWGETCLEMVVDDDGVGYDHDRAAQEGHFGIANMHARALAIGARLEISSQKDNGTRIHLIVPFETKI